jgi:1-deoxy-D-xylulose-5-phosphate reductoisomerase
LNIPEIIEEAMSRHHCMSEPSVDEILATEAETYELIESRWN